MSEEQQYPLHRKEQSYVRESRARERKIDRERDRERERAVPGPQRRAELLHARRRRTPV